MKRFCKNTLLCLIPCLALCFFMAGCTALTSQKAVEPFPPNKSNMTTETVFACNPSALDKDQRARYSVLTKQLIAEKQEVQELPDGYALRYSANPQSIKDVAEFVGYERLCCPFLNFEIGVEGENLSLRLRGQEGVKEFIKMEFGI